MNIQPSMQQRFSNKRSAWTLMEMMISVLIGTMILAALLSTYFFANRTLDATANYAELDRQSRNALDKITTILREVGAVSNQTTNTIWLTSSTNSGPAYPSMLNWSKDRATLEYSVNNSVTNVLLKGCTFLKFSYFQRNPSNSTTMLFWPSTNASFTKVVVMDWICKKTNYSTLTDSESVQTAKVVLRN